MFYDWAVAPPSSSESPIDISAYSADRARRLTGLSARQIQYWDEQDFIRPSLTKRKGRGRRRLYSFRDLLSLRVAADLRQHVSLHLIRKVTNHLRRLNYRDPLAELSFVVVGDKLYFRESSRWQESRQLGQVIASYVVPVGAIAADLQRQIALDAARARRPGVIEQRRGVLGGKAVLAGTRIPVQAVKNLLRDGAAEEEILELYPDLDVKDIRAAQAADLSQRRQRAS